ncbi:helix-turn-helix domain-containing protein [Oceanobacillus halophilus]|uniref:XRE family transcriptional regulator n=1 Tax=Oceanobacillus halophilus TaxID=930130 RepID=A0A494ZVP9_9BACI|nr:helix-turn-helix transcriptional regulator [Oceanobacillus halophilus]RKQ28666.1 XRE family transcriptional regulator [Oceanobacillus halophilus]
MSDFIKRYSELRGNDYVKSLQVEGRIAAQIKTQRKSLNLSQQELADASGLPKSTVGRIEAGITSPKVDTLLKISKALGIPFIIDGSTGNDDSNMKLSR